MTKRVSWYSELYDAVTAQLDHELDSLGYEGNVEGVESLERIKAAVADVNRKQHDASQSPRPVHDLLDDDDWPATW